MGFRYIRIFYGFMFLFYILCFSVLRMLWFYMFKSLSITIPNVTAIIIHMYNYMGWPRFLVADGIYIHM